MRFDTPVFFQKIVRGAYDASTGNYADDTVTETEKYADVTETGIETLQLIYGGIKQDSKTVRIQGNYYDEFSRIRIGAKAYKVDRARHLLNKDVYVVSEVQ